MSWSSIADAIWEGGSVGAGTTRAVLSPLASLFGRVVARRNARFDGMLPRAAALPALSIGNLTVGGTGKTPVAAWCIEQLRARGARPAIVMRGVGDDEWRVHGLLNPGSRVIVSPDRRNGLVVAKTQGADCAVLDDAFQHRQAARVVDIVLVSADRWRGRSHDSDRELFLEVLAEVSGCFNWTVHSYCLMGNHYHLLLETPDGNLSKGMRQLNGVYTQRFNRKHKRVGHVFQGRPSPRGRGEVPCQPPHRQAPAKHRARTPPAPPTPTLPTRGRARCNARRKSSPQPP